MCISLYVDAWKDGKKASNPLKLELRQTHRNMYKHYVYIQSIFLIVYYIVNPSKEQKIESMLFLNCMTCMLGAKLRLLERTASVLDH